MSVRSVIELLTQSPYEGVNDSRSVQTSWLSPGGMWTDSQQAADHRSADTLSEAPTPADLGGFNLIDAEEVS